MCVFAGFLFVSLGGQGNFNGSELRMLKAKVVGNLGLQSDKSEFEFPLYLSPAQHLGQARSYPICKIRVTIHDPGGFGEG